VSDNAQTSSRLLAAVIMSGESIEEGEAVYE
jgi:hypothetical protein